MEEDPVTGDLPFYYKWRDMHQWVLYYITDQTKSVLKKKTTYFNVRSENLTFLRAISFFFLLRAISIGMDLSY